MRSQTSNTHDLPGHSEIEAPPLPLPPVLPSPLPAEAPETRKPVEVSTPADIASRVKRWLDARSTSYRWILVCGCLYASLTVAYFARGLLDGKLIAAGDAVGEYFPQFTYPYHSWTRLLFNGYPLFADPQNMSFLPTRVLFSAIGAWDVFMVSAYVLAGCWACLYAYEVTRDRFAALMAGLIYGATGHMLRNLTLVPMIQSIAWAPLVFWALERQVRGKSWTAVILGAIGIACSCFGGYAQITAYTSVMALLYAGVGLARAANKRQFLGGAAALFTLGGLLSAVQWLPTAELAFQSNRTHLPFDSFAAWSWPFLHSAELLIPRAFLGPWDRQTMEACTVMAKDPDQAYFGLIPLILGGAGAWLTRRSSVAWFWCAAGLFSFMLAFGDRTPIVGWLYHVPAYNLFRVLIRHSMFLALGLAVLSACTIASFRTADIRNTHRRAVAIASGVVTVLFAVAAWALSSNGCVASPQSKGVLTSAVALIASVVAVAAWTRAPLSLARSIALIGCLALDLLTFDGWGAPSPHYSHRELSSPTDFVAPEGTDPIRAELETHHQRIWGVGGPGTGRPELAVNGNLLYGIPSAVGYSPIALSRSMKVMNVDYGGSALGPFWKQADSSIDVAAVRLVTVTDRSHTQPVGVAGLRWAKDDLQLRLGFPGTQDTVPQVELALGSGEITGVALVLDMEYSEPLEQGSTVATLEIVGDQTISIPLLAGVDLSEWAIDCSMIHVRTRHSRAELFDSRPVRFFDEDCAWSRFVTIKRLSQPIRAQKLRIVRTGGTRNATVRIHKINILSPGEPHGSALDGTVAALTQDPRWIPRQFISPGRLMFQNRRALPRARFVDGTIQAPPDDVLSALRTGVLPSGVPFEAAHDALVSPGVTVNTRPGCKDFPIQWLDDLDGFTRFAVDLPVPCYLVLADTYYNGWVARVDGQSTPIHLTNYTFRGVEVPAGKHQIEFEFESRTLWAGAVVSSGSLGLVAVLTALRRRKRSRDSS